ncbi:LacI family transcriptional regulator [Aquisalinus flavus]|uniref:LacI family transcriptional regulator n=2 Tax=Aquisalinus flavus TaxID=1526572 RepID=A0A8J2V4P1_9PROT|nr:LacI family transcriptional regulator [Aquisalinus flavus]GGC98726.1 LacI family transcriptional regulator [Aquisalinus flavus]
MPMTGRRVTIQTVADQAGVSKKTVSRVLNREKGVNPLTEEKVMDAVRALGFKPNIAARSLAGSRSYNIALAYDDPSSEYMAGIQGGVLEICRLYGYHLMLEPLDKADLVSAADGQDQEAERGGGLFGMRHLDGVILMPPLSDNEQLVDALVASGQPVVLISSGLERDNVLHVRIDEMRAAREMTRHLIELGHRRIAFIVGRKHHGAALRRHKGFLAEMEAHGLDVPAGRIADGDFTFDSGMAATERLLASPDRPTAIFAGNDHMAAGVMASLYQHGLKVPGDISVAGFDGAQIAKMVWPPLTTVNQPLDALGRAAGERLITRIQRGAGEGGGAQTLSSRMIVGGTTAPPK